MQDFRYIDDVATLQLDRQACIGCGSCVEVCPHRVLAMEEAERKVRVQDRNGCIECGACAMNCPTRALTVTPGVGCAAYIIKKWIKGGNAASCC